VVIRVKGMCLSSHEGIRGLLFRRVFAARLFLQFSVQPVLLSAFSAFRARHTTIHDRLSVFIAPGRAFGHRGDAAGGRKRWLKICNFGLLSLPQGGLGWVVVPSCGTTPLVGADLEPCG